MPIVSGGCPLECCGLGQWTAPGRTAALRTPDSRADTAFIVERDSVVKALRNRLVIKTPGVVVFTRAHTFLASREDGRTLTARQPMTRAAGDTIYTVGLEGEATDAWFWHAGHTYHSSDNLDVFRVHEATADKPYAVLSEPTFEWWVEARAANGTTGWLFDPWRFKGTGSCG
jgi:hypothetical protein